MISIRRFLPLALVATTAACSLEVAQPPRQFLEGTETDPLILTTVLSLSNAVLQLQIGSPATQTAYTLGASSQVTPVGFALRDTRIAVPTGNAASVTIADLITRNTRIYTWDSGNATGAAWLNDSVVITTNPSRNEVGRINLSSGGTDINDVRTMPAYPTDVVVVNGRIFVVSSNLDANFAPAGNGIVTELDGTTFNVVRSFTVGRNPSYAAAFNGRLFVTNSGDFASNNGTLSVIDLTANTVSAPISGFGDFPGPISIDAQGRAYISGFGSGTIIYNTVGGTFVRGAANPLCAPVNGVCRGATGAQLASNGRIYQSFFGSSSANQPGRIFIYDGTSLALTDSIDVPVGASAVDVRAFR